MGEVFRADDLKLGQPVALKFLPHGMARDADRLARLYAEVRVARQIAHPNVCRVYDIGEVDGEHFISMEYIEGENLATLLRRIGRLPETKAIQIARQIAAGVAAAHDKGVLHRDLKPANIMLDERGVARITDFGLAAILEEVGSAKAVEGTPAYMAPEQLAGEGVSVRSDIYSLGLVLYELFTGTRAYESNSVGELIQKRQSSPPPTPSAVTPDINPSIEHLIQQCLEHDPRNRPPSALAVAAALPGGDPLAAALAAGETPSPELLAAAGQTVGMTPMQAVACLIAVILSFLVLAAARDAEDGSPLASMPRSTEQLAVHAREIATRLGYKEQPYRAYGFEEATDYIRYIKEHDKSRRRWQRLSKGHPAQLYFWYRESPRALAPRLLFANGRVLADDPPNSFTGGFRMWLEPSGALRSFDAPSPEIAEASPPRPIDWNPLFELAGVDARTLQATTSRWTPLLWGDTRTAWQGPSPEQKDVNVRFEGAGFQGRVVSFQSIYPWEKPSRDTESEMPLREKTIGSIAFTLLTIMLVVAGLLVRRNIVLGRGDRRGAFRFAVAVITLRLIASLLTATHVLSPRELVIIIPCVANALLAGVTAWLLYVAIEPYARRRWPQTLISWNRLLLGQFRDPVLGRDVLIGITAGTVVIAAASALLLLDRSDPPSINTTFLLGTRQSFGAVFGMVTTTLIAAMATYLLLFIFRVITRRDWAAVAILVVINAASAAVISEGHWILAAVSIVANTLGLILLLRFGIVVLLAWNFAAPLIGTAPLTLHLSQWYGGTTLIVAAVVAAVTIWAFRASLAGRPLFSEALFDA